MSKQENRTNVVKHNVSLLTVHDIYLFKEGSHFKIYDKLGSHVMTINGEDGVYFAVWAPGAKNVSVMGDFNGWNRQSHLLKVRNDESGVWEGFIPGIKKGDIYKYHIRSRYNGYRVDKGAHLFFIGNYLPKLLL